MSNDIEKLYHHGQQESPPLALDNLILNQAKQSCEIQKKQPRPWLYGLSTAAALVFSFGLIYSLQNQNQQMQVSPNRTTPKQEIEVQFESDMVQKQEQRLKKRSPLKQQAISKKPAFPGTTVMLNSELENIEESINEYNSPNSDSETLSPFAAAPLSISMPIPRIAADEQQKEDKPQADNADSLKDTIREQKKVKKYIMPQAEEPRYLDLDDNEDLERKTILADKTPHQKLNEQLKELDKLIENKKFKQAQKFLKKLKIKYPDYNFSTYKRLIDL